MADAATTDPADQDPISQTFTSGNALNAKNFIDYQFQYGNMALADAQRSVRDLDEYRQNLRAYNLQAMARAETVNTQAIAMLTAVNTQAARVLLDQTGDALSDAITGMQGVKAGQTTPPVYQDPTNGAAGVNGLVSAVAQLTAALAAFSAGTSIPAAAVKAS